MKIRTDFVTNSSSASYILEINIYDENDQQAEFHLAVSEETCFSDDGDMTASGISLVPKKKSKKIVFGQKQLSGAQSINDLCDLLFSNANIFEWIDHDKKGNDCDEDDYDEDDYGEAVTVQDVAPKTIAKFINECDQKRIEVDKIKTLVIKNGKFGTGDSAMWINCRDLLEAFEEYCISNSFENSDDKLEQLIEFVKSTPLLNVNDNTFNLPSQMRCKWMEDENSLKSEMTQLLNGALENDYWMGTYYKEYSIDPKTNTLTESEFLYFGDI